MATLVSPGVSVTVTNESFYFPATATTVPVFFIATRANKFQVDGVTPAAGTVEANVVRTVTSVKQSLELYGVPHFRKDNAGNEFHGDARNEYGLLALNQFLGAASRAFVIRADIDLNDEDVETFISLGTPRLVADSVSVVGIGNGTLTQIAAASEVVKPQVITISFTTGTSFRVSGSVSGYLGGGAVGQLFSTSQVTFRVNAGSVAFSTGDSITFELEYGAAAAAGNTGNGTVGDLMADVLAVPETITITMTSPTAFSVLGSVSGVSPAGSVGVPYENNRVSFTIYAGDTPFAVGDEFTIETTEVTIEDPLGTTDALRRTKIVTALQAAINSNADIRSELYEFNLTACPGYWETVDELAALVVDTKEEALVVADTPMNMTAEQVAKWAMTSARVASQNVAYYYPWALTSNLDGRDVLAPPSSAAMRTIAYSDEQSYVWMAPAGVSRGVVTGVSAVGYVTGTLGTATTFVEVSLNDGQRDNLYEYFKNINPITYFPGRGILLWGQKTSAPAASAMDRINVQRLVGYLRRVLRKGAQPFVFQPNDAITRNDLKSVADGMLSDVMTKRGLYDFATLCDESNNTATRIDKNELWLDIAIAPVKAAEFIYIPIRVVSTGTDI